MNLPEKYRNFHFGSVRVAVLLDELQNMVVFSLFGLKVERLPMETLLPDYMLYFQDCPEKRIRCSLLELICLRTMIERGELGEIEEQLPVNSENGS